jgi:hypothetical protein
MAQEATMTNHKSFAGRWWLSLCWVGVAAACGAARGLEASALPSAGPRLPSATHSTLLILGATLDTAATSPAEEPPIRATEGPYGPPPEETPTSSRLVLFRSACSADISPGGFSLGLQADLWGVIDLSLTDGPDLKGAGFELELTWPPPQPPSHQLFPYDLGPRRWRELSTWEQIGAVVQTASAAAGLIYLLDRLF